jgi:hypothetical protein
MVTTSDIGVLEVKNQPKYAPFTVEYEDFAEADAIQVDIIGIGIFRYFEGISDEILLEINTNINRKLTIYGNKTGHNAANIGWYLNLKPLKKLNISTNTLVFGADVSLFFKKPVKNATCYSLQPTITLISLIVLSEIFHLRTND